MLTGIKKDIIKRLIKVGLRGADLKDLAYPETQEFGDISLPLFRFAKEFKKSPVDLARDFAAQLEKIKISGVQKIESKGGYINFFIDTEKFGATFFKKIFKDKEAYGNRSLRKKKKVLIEFVSPNSNKPLHLGHLRNAALGEAVARLLETQGVKVLRANIVNDRGIHICKAMVAYEEFGKFMDTGRMIIDSPAIARMKGDHFVGKYYVTYSQELAKRPGLEEKARECLVKWEAGEKETIKLWKTMRNWVTDGFNETYTKLGLHFDRIDHESEIWKFGKEIITEGLQKKIFERDKGGAVVANLEKFKLPNKVLLRSDGTSIYITTDLYLALKRYREEKFDELIYVVGSEQDLYFKQLFAVFQMLKLPYAATAHHLSYGMVFLPEGKMKSREGTVVDADDLVSKLQNYAAEEVRARHDFLHPEEVQERARIIALAALKYYLLAVNPPSSMHFNPRESLAFSGKTGPYLLYTLARTKSILHKRAEEQRNEDIERPETKETKKQRDRKIEKKFDVREFGKAAKFLKKKEERELILLLGKFEEVLTRAAHEFDPEELASYLYALARAFSDFYEKHSVLDAEPNTREARLHLVQAVSLVLDKGLRILGIETLEQM